MAAKEPKTEKERILVVEDEEDIAELIQYNLQREGYRTLHAPSGETALKLAQREKPDLVLLDLMLPGLDGLEVCRRLKAEPQTSRIPIVMVTAKGDETDVVAGLELGAEDYLTKPFSPRVLLARMRGVLRRRRFAESEAEMEPVRRGPLLIHPGRREVTLEGRRVELTYTEFNLLHLLARRPGWVFSRDKIVDAVRGYDVHVTERSVDVHILGLRKKLGGHADLVETVRGAGYRFREEEK